MKKKKRSNELLIAFLLTIIVAGLTFFGVKALENALERNKVPAASYQEENRKDSSVSEVTDDEKQEAEGEAEAESKSEEESENAAKPDTVEVTSSEQPSSAGSETGSENADSGSQKSEQTQEPVMTDSPLDENELPDYP